MTNVSPAVIVILGNGAAGLTAAQTVREHNKQCEIIMISNELLLSYRRPLLTKSLGKIPDLTEIIINDEAWYQQNGIKTILGKHITKINPETKTIHLDDHSEISYDKCIYALGAESFIPPVPGKDKKGVYAVRKMTDLWAIREQLPDTKKIVIIGGGVLGLEAAWELSKTGCQISVIERGESLMTRQLDADSSKLLSEIAESKGITVYYQADTSEITGDDQVTGILLKDGTHIETDMVIFSTGAIANTTIAKESQLAVNRGVLVNDYLETNIADIYACGDCAEYQGISYKLWTEASAMGQTAGKNCCGIPVKYHLDPPPLIYHGMDTMLFAIGTNGSNPDKHYEVVKKADDQQKTYEAYYFEDNQLAGVIVVGGMERFDELNQAVIQRRSKQELGF